jgi:hypothetical protein
MKTICIKNRIVYRIAVLSTGIVSFGIMMQSCSGDMFENFAFIYLTDKK